MRSRFALYKLRPTKHFLRQQLRVGRSSPLREPISELNAVLGTGDDNPVSRSNF